MHTFTHSLAYTYLLTHLHAHTHSFTLPQLLGDDLNKLFGGNINELDLTYFNNRNLIEWAIKYHNEGAKIPFSKAWKANADANKVAKKPNHRRQSVKRGNATARGPKRN
jgi:hypothetical protein